MMRLYLFMSIFVLVVAQIARASQIAVSGYVYGTWDYDTVLVVGDIRIPPDNDLTIVPGVEVLFDGPFRMSVDPDAQIVAVGTPGDRIVFRPLRNGETWRGIRMELCCGLSILDYCDFRHAVVSGIGDTARGGAIYLDRSSLAIYHCTFDSCSAPSGGAICCDNSSRPIISDCIFQHNAATLGGAVFCRDTSRPLILASSFASNRAEFTGAAIHVEYASATISQNSFGNNSGNNACVTIIGPDTTMLVERNTIISDSSEAVILINDMGPWSALIRSNEIRDNAGVAIFAEVASPVIEGNTILRNAGGLELWYSSSTVICNEISQNRGEGVGFWNDPISLPLTIVIDHNLIDGNQSAGIDGDGSGLIITNNHVTRNKGGIAMRDCEATLEHNTIAGNRSPEVTGGFDLRGGSANLRHCILAQNIPESTQVYYGGTNDVTLDSCIVSGSWQGTGNADIDPLFRDTANGDFHTMSDIVTTKPLPSCGNNVPDSMEIWIDSPQSSIENPSEAALPVEFVLSQNYPNPFNPHTAIMFSLPHRANVRLEIFNTLGQLLRTLCHADLPAGEHRFEWDGKDDRAQPAASGVYLYRLTADETTLTRKMLLVK